MRDDEFLLGRHTRERARVCGLRRRVFYLLLAFALFLVVGLVVGLTVCLTVLKSSNSDYIPGGSSTYAVPQPPSEAPESPS